MRVSATAGGVEVDVERRVLVRCQRRTPRVLPPRRNDLPCSGGIELWRPPDLGRRLGVELLPVQGERRVVLGLEHVRLAGGGHQLGIVVEVALQDVATELPVGPAEEQVLVPHLVDHPGRCDTELADDAEVDEFLVFANGVERKGVRPAELSGELAAEGLGGGVGTAE